MTAYYNENDAFCAQWLRTLIGAGLIAPGDVDERSIAEVSPYDLAGYTQCHFFAGIGVWSYTLRSAAGWSDDIPVWTASCPCPPWSRARRHNKASMQERDARDLWPVFNRLLAVCKPDWLFGEQVAGPRAAKWLDRAKHDCKESGFKFVSRTREAACCGAPQRRARTFFLAEFVSARRVRLGSCINPSEVVKWGWRGEADLRAIATAPFERGDRWPEPLFRSMDDGPTTIVRRLRAYGNAIVPQEAAAFIREMTNGPTGGLLCLN